MAEDAWNTRDPAKVTLAYTIWLSAARAAIPAAKALANILVTGLCLAMAAREIYGQGRG